MPPKNKFIKSLGGKSHRSKAEQKEREDKEVKLGDVDLVLPAHVKKDKVALKKWKWLVALYKSQKIELVTSADSDMVADFCICHSEYLELLNLKIDMKKDLESQETTALQIIVAMDKSNIDNMINKKREARSKLSAKLLLDPISRVRAVPLEPPKKKKKGRRSDGLSRM